MNSTVAEGVLTIFIDGRIDGSNARQVGDEMDALIDKNPTCSMRFDARNLAYISSAGLRVLLGASKKKKEKCSIVNVSPDVMSILQTTGFTELFMVSAPMREVSVEGLEEIGRGATAVVYRYDEERIIKVYRKTPMNTVSFIEHERNVSKEIFTRLPEAAMPFEIVTAGDSIGVIYEMIKADTLADYVVKHPDRMDDIIKSQTALLKKIHATTFEHSVLPDIRKRIVTEVRNRLTDLFTEDELSELEASLNSVPDRNTMIHGDFNMGNVMVNDKGELLLIDVGDSCIGHPVFEFASMMPLPIVMDGIVTPRELLFIMTGGNDSDAAYELMRARDAIYYDRWRRTISGYFGIDQEEELDRIQDHIKTFAYAMCLYVFSVLMDGRRNEFTDRLPKGLLERFLSHRGEISELPEWWKV